jgi:hypothetical protein
VNIHGKHRSVATCQSNEIREEAFASGLMLSSITLHQQIKSKMILVGHCRVEMKIFKLN